MNPCPFHAGVLADLIFCRSFLDLHIFCEFVTAPVLSCLGDSHNLSAPSTVMFPEPCGENMWYRYPTGGWVSPDIHSLCFDQFQVSALAGTLYLKLLRRFLLFFILHYSQQLLLALGVTLTPYSRSLLVSSVCGTRALVWLTLKLCKLGYLCCDLMVSAYFFLP